ncbi:MAG: hypothetical protein WD335_00925 [Candidatus Paceibacterota bacterium]
MPEEKFESSSFIPKGVAHYQKPKTSGSGGTGGIGASSGAFFKVGLGFAGFIGLLAAAVFFYTLYLESNLVDVKQQFSQAQDTFEPEVINELDAIDTQISSMTEILNNHTAVTPVFDLIESITLSSVQLINASVQSTSRGVADNLGRGRSDEAQIGTPDGDVVVSLTGLAPSFAATALQAQAIADNEQLINAVVSQFSLTEQGDVAFSIQFSLPVDYMSYETTI